LFSQLSLALLLCKKSKMRALPARKTTRLDCQTQS
jgi:hypothetical protein